MSQIRGDLSFDHECRVLDIRDGHAPVRSTLHHDHFFTQKLSYLTSAATADATRPRFREEAEWSVKSRSTKMACGTDYEADEQRYSYVDAIRAKSGAFMALPK